MPYASQASPQRPTRNILFILYNSVRDKSPLLQFLPSLNQQESHQLQLLQPLQPLLPLLLLLLRLILRLPFLLLLLHDRL